MRYVRSPFVAVFCALVSGCSAGASQPDGPSSDPICLGAQNHYVARVEGNLITSGLFHTCLIDRSGALYCWGENHDRQLGDGTWEDRVLPTRVEKISDAIDVTSTHYATCVARESGKAACWGSGFGRDPADVEGLSNVVRVAAGGSTACAITTDGSVTCASRNQDSGAWIVEKIAGITDAVDLAFGDRGLCVLHACGSVSCATGGAIGPAGHPITMKRMAGLEDATKLVASKHPWNGSASLYCALRKSGRVACWASEGGRPAPPLELNNVTGITSLWGGLGICVGTEESTVACFAPTMVDVPDTNGIRGPDIESFTDAPIAVVNGGAMRCALAKDRTPTCWARELGGRSNELFMPMPLGESPFVHAAIGRTHTCVAETEGSVQCWGPVQAGAGYHKGGYSYWTGQRMSGMRDIVEVAAGDGFACGRTAPGEVFCFGRGDVGQLGGGVVVEDRHIAGPIRGLEDAVSLSVASRYGCAAKKTGRLVCWGDSPSRTGGVTLHDVPSVDGAVEVKTADTHVCARRRDASVGCWGKNDDGQLDTSGVSDAAELAVGTGFTCVRRTSGSVSCFGRAQITQGATALSSDVISLAAGGDQACAVHKNGSVTCWGHPEWIRPWKDIKTAKSVVTSGDTTCVRIERGSLHCWGSSKVGQLGRAVDNVRYPPTPLPLP